MLALSSPAEASQPACALAPNAKTQTGEISHIGGDGFSSDVQLRWSASADCPDVAALDGRTFGFVQDLRLELSGRRRVGGAARLTLSEGDRTYTLEGDVRGTFERSTSALTLDLDVLANSDRLQMRFNTVLKFNCTDEKVVDLRSFVVRDLFGNTGGAGGYE